MIKEAIAKGATIEAAQAIAAAELNAPEGVEVKTEVLAVPGKKTLGIFGGKAKVRVYYEIPDFVPAEEKKPEPAKPERKEFAKPAPKAPAKPAPKAEKAAPAAKAEEAEAPAEPYEDEATIEYLRKILVGLGVEKTEISAKKVSGSVIIDIDCGDNYGIVIGRRGETLDSIQYLVSLVANRGEGEYIRVTLNVGNYRQKREDTLRGVAKRSAARVLRSGRNVVLEPMNPYERRIIHTAVQEVKGVVSHSVGNDTDRRVVITLAEGTKPTGGYDNDRRRPQGRGRYNDRSRGERRPAYTPEPNDRAPRSDVKGAARYGKIEIEK